MIEELPKRRAGFGLAGLFAIDCVKSGIDPYAGSCEKEAPVGNILLEGVIISEHVHIGKYDEDPTDESDEIGCDPFRNKRDHPLPVRIQQTINLGVLARFVLVVAQLGQPLL